MGVVVVERSVECASTARRLWCVITDTERMNRAIGMGPLKLTPNSDGTAARYLVKTVSGGFPIEYEERPFEWTENESFSVHRVLRKGLVREMRNTFRLEPLEDGRTRIHVKLEVEPNFGLIAPVVSMQVRRFAAKLIDEFRQIDQELQEGKDGQFSYYRPSFNREALTRVGEVLLESVSDDDVDIAKKLTHFVATASDTDVERIRPYLLADRWKVPRRKLLAVCLHAVAAGLLELKWDIICPSCRTSADRLAALSDLSDHAECQLCDLEFEPELDRAVEVTFQPPAALRKVDPGPFCIGGPARTPHVITQRLLPANGQVTVRAPRSPGKYLMFMRGGATATVNVEADGPSSLGCIATADSITPNNLVVSPHAKITIDHQQDLETHVKIERRDYRDEAASAHEISTLAEFRRQFSGEVLRPGISLRVARVSLLFTDLTDSTALYARIGDAKAFKVVQEHFDLLNAIVDEHGGVIVKTIGDAIMCSFTQPEAAIRCAAAMHAAFPSFRDAHDDAGNARLKIGVHAGACYAVTANGLLDYFGQTVNLAARLQGAAHGGEIVMVESLADEAREGGWIPSDSIANRFSAELKGVDGVVAAARVKLDD